MLIEIQNDTPLGIIIWQFLIKLNKTLTYGAEITRLCNCPTDLKLVTPPHSQPGSSSSYLTYISLAEMDTQSALETQE